MPNVFIDIENVEVKNFDSRNSSLSLNVIYKENGDISSIQKKLNLGTSAILFVKDLFRDIKRSAKVKYNIEHKERFDNIVTVLFDRKEDGETEEKLVNIIGKIKDKAKSFRGVKSADNYLNKLYEINNLKMNVK